MVLLHPSFFFSSFRMKRKTTKRKFWLVLLDFPLNYLSQHLLVHSSFIYLFIYFLPKNEAIGIDFLPKTRFLPTDLYIAAMFEVVSLWAFSLVLFFYGFAWHFSNLRIFTSWKNHLRRRRLHIWLRWRENGSFVQVFSWLVNFNLELVVNIWLNLQKKKNFHHIYPVKTGNNTVRKCIGMKKTQGLQRMILFREIFTNVKRFGF